LLATFQEVFEKFLPDLQKFHEKSTLRYLQSAFLLVKFHHTRGAFGVFFEDAGKLLDDFPFLIIGA